LRLLGAGGVRFARSPYVFCSANGLPISVQFYNEVLRRTGKELRLPFVLSSHVWRHSLATYRLNVQRANLREVQEILGHSRLETTARYTHVTPQARRLILEKVCLKK
jgi:integrase/recombinase XerC